MAKTQLAHNIDVHNKIAKKYEVLHGEIYNDIEQSRLKEKLKQAISYISTDSTQRVALDFGCGAGNLTRQLTNLGCTVIAADVSSGFLDLVASRTYEKEVKTFTLNGTNLEGIADTSLDLVAMYSVLHHVPDYLSLMKEFLRVLKPGGILYIDHEASNFFWKEGEYIKFQQEMRRNTKKNVGKFFVLTNYVDKFIRTFINPKYQREGDIHVFKDDHIEWDLIRKELIDYGVTVIAEEDYLLYRRNYNKATYDKWSKKIGDMHVFIGKKL